MIEINNKKIKLKVDAPPNQDIQTTIELDIAQDAFPELDTPNNKTHVVFYKIIEIKPTERGYINLTDRFPYRPSQGNKYIIVGYNYDGNYILVEPIKNREVKSITDA